MLIQMLEKTEWVVKNGQSRETINTGHTRHTMKEKTHRELSNGSHENNHVMNPGTHKEWVIPACY